MATHKLTTLVARRLGNHRTRRDLLGQASFPGLTIDNLASTPIGASSITSQIASLSPQLAALNTLQQTEAQLDAEALVQRSAGGSSGASSGGSSWSGVLGTLATGVLGGGFGLSSIVQGLFNFFGGAGGPATQPLMPFNLPATIQYAAGITGPGSAAVPVDYGQGGQIRSLSQASTSTPAATAGPPGPTVHVNVSAMDSRSFLDRSDDIANAVRAAILNSHPLNDVISSL